jgi:Tfp pilus assembly protein PilF
MNANAASRPTPPRLDSWHLWIAAELLVLLVCLAYSNSFRVPFVYDDQGSITKNPSIWHLASPVQLVSPPHEGQTVGGRPVLNISLAINYAIGGTSTWGYHFFNLVIHLGAGLVLFGIVRRTLLQPRLRDHFGDDSLFLAFAVAGLWLLHPLQTESVTYIVQRAESMMGLFYLLTLYGFIRGAESDSPRTWYALSVGACLLGMATKEVIVSAPLAVMLYDRTFVAGTFRQAWSRRRGYYLALAATWVLLVGLALSVGSRNDSALFNRGISWSDYVTMQFYALIEYLRLSVWPSPLIFDYTGYRLHNPMLVALDAVLVVLLITLTILGLRRGTAFGFCGFCYFAILAPTSSVLVASAQPLSDHRMYLPLAAVLAVEALSIYRMTGRKSRPLFAMLILAAAILTYERNIDYRSNLALWTDTARKLPNDPVAQANLGSYLLTAGKIPEAKAMLEHALALGPNNAFALNNLGIITYQEGSVEQALALFRKSLWANPRYPWTYYNYGYALDRLGRRQEAIAEYQQALILQPHFTDVQKRLAQLQAAENSSRQNPNAALSEPEHSQRPDP